MRISARRHEAVYREIPACYRPGMRDVELQIEIEKRMRMHGSLGYFRAFGSNMDIFMGSILAGENAEVPSPFDFALGGSGIDASCPLGANGTPLKEGTAIMVDMAGNYTAYMTDMTRVFSVGHLTELAYRKRDREYRPAGHTLCRTLRDSRQNHRKPETWRILHGDQATSQIRRARHRHPDKRAAGTYAPLERHAGTEHGICTRTENRITGHRPCRNRKLMGGNQRRSRKTNHL